MSQSDRLTGETPGMARAPWWLPYARRLEWSRPVMPWVMQPAVVCVAGGLDVTMPRLLPYSPSSRS